MTTSDKAATSATPSERGVVRIVAVLIAIEVFAFFETSMALAAIPTFMRVFEADAAAVGWTSTAYLLAGAASAATAGRLGDIFGRRRVLVIVLGLAAFGSLISVAAHELWIVVLGRGIQGLAAGALPLCFGLVRELLPARRVPMVMSLLGGVIPICTGIGALIAGLLLDLSGWRAMFVAATVVGVISTVLAIACLPRTPGMTPRPTVDLIGGVLLAPASGGILFGATQGVKWGWGDSRVLLAFGLGVVAVAVWVWWERRVPAPMVNLKLFANRKLLLTTLATVMVGLGAMGPVSLLSQMVMQLPVTAPVGLGLSPTIAGYMLLIVAVLSYVGAIISGRIAQAAGARWSLMIGMATFTLGIILWIFLAKSVVGTVGCLCLTGIGAGFCLSALPILVVEVVPERNTGEATGMNRVTQNIAVACGLSFTSVILASSTVPGTTMPTRPALVAAFIAIGGVSLVGLVISLCIRGDRPVQDAPAPAHELDAKPA